MRLLTVTSNEAGQRLDKLLAKYLSGAGKGFLYKMMRKKNITLNGSRCQGSEHLVLGDEIRLFLSDETIEKFSGGQEQKRESSPGTGRSEGRQGSSVKLDIIYEDDNILLVNKPVGMLSQKAKEGDISLNEHILAYLLRSGRLSPEQLRTFRPSVCNRLDRNTSGLVAAGVSLAGLQGMSEVLRDRSIHKYYQCLVAGSVTKRQVIDGFLRKNEASNRVTVSDAETEGSVPIRTEYLPLAGNGRETLLQVTLITGRSHQIRAHLASIGHPILGDAKYGNPQANRRLRERYQIHSQLLHAWRLTLPEQLPEALRYLAGREFRAPLPEAFRRVLEGEGLLDRSRPLGYASDSL